MVSSSAGMASVEPPRRLRLLEGDLPQQLLAVLPVEGRPQRQQLVQRRAQRVDVGAVVDRHALGQRLLRAHVTQRAHQVARHRQAGLAVLHVGQAEVGHPQLAAPVQQQVGRLDVAMDDAQLVGVVQRLGRLDAQLGHAAEVCPAAAGANVVSVDAGRRCGVRRRGRDPGGRYVRPWSDVAPSRPAGRRPGGSPQLADHVGQRAGRR